MGIGRRHLGGRRRRGKVLQFPGNIFFWAGVRHETGIRVFSHFSVRAGRLPRDVLLQTEFTGIRIGFIR